MATITTDTYLDGGTARTAGEAWTCNGGRLTIRTDSRWHANAPASMTGSLAAVTISATLGGGYTIDGRNVRWMAYDGGSGTVPAIGTTITGGTSGCTGYLLGVWSAINAAPTAVGAAMPATGFIKFREVSAAFVDNDVLSGITATANGVDRVGWIEVVHDQAVAITVPRLGDFTVIGDWFDLGVTTGSANQVIQLPTNGSATTYIPGIWIANVASPTTDDDYDYYPSMPAANMTTTNLGTDARSKFVLMGTNGSVTIGHNGTTAVGYVPPSGRAIRIPNVFGRQCATGTRATNAIPHATVATRPDFATTSAGYIDVEHFVTDWYLYFLQPYYVKLNHVATFDIVSIAECASPLDLYDGGTSQSAALDLNSLLITSNFAGGSIEKWKAQRYAAGTNDHDISINYCIGQTFDNCDAGIIQFVRSTGRAYQVTQCTGLTFNNCRQFNQGMTFTTSFDCTVNGMDHCDRYVGATTTAGVYGFTLAASCKNIVIDGVTFGLGGTIANVHPYTSLINVGNSVDCKIRNIGTKAAPLNGGSANAMGTICASSGNNLNIKYQRIYVIPTRTGAISTLNSDKNCTYEHVYGDGADAILTAELNCHLKNCGGTSSVTGQASCYGTHFWDAFVSDTVGRITLPMNEPTSETSAYVTIVSGTPKFTSAGQLVMATVGDEVIFEMDYFCLGVTALTNTAPVVTGTNATYVSGPDWGNHDIYFQYDIGAGWNGSWLDLTATNLSGAGAIDPAVGVKLKYRVVCDTTNTTNALTYIRIQTTSTLAAQTDNLYPLDTVTLSLTGLVSGSDVTILAAGTETVLDTTEDWAGTTYGYTYETPQSVDIALYKPGYMPFFIRNYSLGTTDAFLPCAQVADASYLT